MLTPVRRGHSWLYFTGATPRGLVAAAWLTPLARANGWNPEVCSLHKASSGQPSLLVGGRWHFASISHAVGLTVIAVHQTCPIGVDVEPIAEGRTDQDLHALYFPEAKPPMVAPQADNDAFLALWTAAEAWLKAHGRGVPDLDEAKNAMIIPGEGSRSWREERCSLGWRMSEVVLDPTPSLGPRRACPTF